MKIVINSCFGGFSVNEQAIRRYAEIKGIPLSETGEGMSKMFWKVPQSEAEEILAFNWSEATKAARAAYNVRYYAANLSRRDFERTDPVLIQVVEELGAEADGDCASLKVEEISNGSMYRIVEYDGNESIEERDDCDWRVAT